MVLIQTETSSVRLNWGWTVEAIYGLPLFDSAANQTCLRSYWLVLLPLPVFSPVCARSSLSGSLTEQGMWPCPAQQVRAQKPRPAVMWWCLYQTAPPALRNGTEWLAVCLFILSLLNISRVQITSHSTLHFLGSSAAHPSSVKSSPSPEAPPRWDVTVFISNSPRCTQTRR